MSARRPRLLAVSIGCPSGIGPEVSVVAAARALERGLRCVLVGDLAVLERAARACALDPASLVRVQDASSAREQEGIAVYCPAEPLAPSQVAFGAPSREGGAAQLAWVDTATDLAASRLADALVTGPVSKHAIARSGAPGAEAFTGHTEHVARRLGAPSPTMVFVAGSIAVGLVTTHLAIADVAAAITERAVADALVHLAETLARMGVAPARIAVAALNPHAGEEGMFGREEQAAIVPGIAAAKRAMESAGIDARVEGPIGAETAMRKAFAGGYDGALAMYHDQATIPLKLRAFGRAVNVTAGLPIVRTSVDHGTAYDIAGQGKADAGSMLEAVLLAARMVR
jgi:4-hydroxythreonine-4-phosphate dehydrogenase